MWIKQSLYVNVLSSCVSVEVYTCMSTYTLCRTWHTARQTPLTVYSTATVWPLHQRLLTRPFTFYTDPFPYPLHRCRSSNPTCTPTSEGNGLPQVTNPSKKEAIFSHDSWPSYLQPQISLVPSFTKWKKNIDKLLLFLSMYINLCRIFKVFMLTHLLDYSRVQCWRNCSLVIASAMNRIVCLESTHALFITSPLSVKQIQTSRSMLMSSVYQQAALYPCVSSRGCILLTFLCQVILYRFDLVNRE